MSILTLTTDFGGDSPYVAQMKGVILGIAPQATLVDITHGIPPQDVLAGSVALADAALVFPEGTIHAAVVDPGVGTDRRIVAVRAAGHWFVAPENGLLSGILDIASPEEIRHVANRELWRPQVSNTFHGRDILAPVAGHLCAGLPPDRIGPPLKETTTLPWPRPRIERDRLSGEVLTIDSFGNIITNVTQTDLDQWRPSEPITVQCGGQVVCGLVQTYADRPRGELAALVGSSGRLEIAEVGGNAARRLGIARGAAVSLRSSS